LKALPRGEARKVTSIQATEGSPTPQAWTIQVPDTKAPGGFREYVVVKGEIVRSQAVGKPEEARGMRPEPLAGNNTIKIDSDQAAQIALQQAKADGIGVVSLNYRLQKSGPKAAPVWVLSCMDDKGRELGSVAISAVTGNVLAQDGFALGGHPVQASQPAISPSRNPQAVDPQTAEEDRKFLAENSGENPSAEPAEAPEAAIPPGVESRLPAGSQPPGPEPATSRETASVAEDRERESVSREPARREENGRERHSEIRVVSPVREIHRATAPVRHIIHRILPF
jgi:hypothetical protein